MKNFEDLIDRVSRLNSKDEAISIHRTAVHIERFNAEQHDLDYLLLDGRYYNAVLLSQKECTSNVIDDTSVTWHFRADPEYAEAYLRDVKIDGFDKEIALVSRWHRWARALGPIQRRLMRRA